ncbi:hypothetical protein IKG10_00855 [Candidatus Saccharibacteria bacterium]|nr:hypothetical protein [Candidatus Saccharibacteria bacterium]
MIVVTIIASYWSVCTIGDKISVPEGMISVWGAVTGFVVSLCVYLLTKEPLYWHLYNHPEAYETPAATASIGLHAHQVFLFGVGVCIALFLRDAGLRHRREKKMKMRQAARAREARRTAK